ncbi:glycosyltransferase [Bradyrhizobium sp. BRP22]|uniref:glycosyltransferase n=1 Tax=Bradyrhizobium sp. BRP22 TaxID=2793821 RepID=UPI001CD4832B|nr:glycosyltransferase [Bradyrhizobium sp. BRP22]
MSIIIPAYNAARYLPESIGSALAQSYSSVEVVVVDDGSTDKTDKVIRSYGRSIKALSQPNSGQSVALNRGLSIATGEMVAYLGADDRLHPCAVEILVDRLAREDNACLAYPDFNLINENSRIVRRIYAPDYDQQRLIAGFHCLPGPGALVRKDAWLTSGGWSAVFRQIPDMDFYFRLSLIGPFCHVSECLADFRVHAASTTFKAGTYEMANEPMRLVSDFFSRPDLPHNIRRWEAKSLANALLLSGFLHAARGRILIAVRCFSRAIRRSPSVIFSRPFTAYMIRSFTRNVPIGYFISLMTRCSKLFSQRGP